ncbi:uncharacterized protein LOC123225550 isoform X1 [Mangifera indica]|uniref:uncharacterized protein LOC123225550 isoform X1 n=1 Tax=Mangifera indica TaxID=29780 RepID=UPI001CFA2410|nr:uncharacterized protein LOC123225550 isoform X1 [Mangifera indica]
MLVALNSVGQGPRLEMITLLMFYPRGSRAGQLWMKLNFEAFWTVVRSRDYQAELDSSSQDERLNEWQDASNEEDKMQMESPDAFGQKLKLAAGREASFKFVSAFSFVIQTQLPPVYRLLSVHQPARFSGTSGRQ